MLPYVKVYVAVTWHWNLSYTPEVTTAKSCLIFWCTRVCVCVPQCRTSSRSTSYYPLSISMLDGQVEVIWWIAPIPLKHALELPYRGLADCTMQADMYMLHIYQYKNMVVCLSVLNYVTWKLTKQKQFWSQNCIHPTGSFRSATQLCTRNFLPLAFICEERPNGVLRLHGLPSPSYRIHLPVPHAPLACVPLPSLLLHPNTQCSTHSLIWMISAWSLHLELSSWFLPTIGLSKKAPCYPSCSTCLVQSPWVPVVGSSKTMDGSLFPSLWFSGEYS